MTDPDERPIVAGLERPETPQETAQRKAAAREKRRANQTAFNLIVAIVASLLIAGFVGALMSNDRPGQVNVIDYAAVAEDAQSGIDTPLVVPSLPERWRANRADVQTGSDQVTVWTIGLVTPTDEYIGIRQGLEANPTWVSNVLERAEPGDTVTVGGREWTEYDQRDAESPGNLAYALVTEAEGSTVVLFGTAPDEEFGVLATAVAEELTP
ncbi:uncharacterized protein DUF4245 [Diaminobutyricimonas aerilata]|uniref:Uncharacterized protein DUF4245 n=1 Tax=Diaminobutyricimonas aerilata TaxID=1162967 RepID=A0A2M9CI09_9MICO|nr:DUF4245 domain-containing protein [Diaminobutyricimonas aerilata]PJJ71512.1 uncharacterized protein DUF4245 [Diaminobutyricimonas aerilata]